MAESLFSWNDNDNDNDNNNKYYNTLKKNKTVIQNIQKNLMPNDSCHPHEHKISSIIYLINRVHTHIH
jgi:hypothetical protein